jgi:hypothetical protein
MRSFVLAILVGAGLACDPCSSMAGWHLERCNGGDQTSCEWVVDNNVDPFGRCQAQ